MGFLASAILLLAVPAHAGELWMGGAGGYGVKSPISGQTTQSKLARISAEGRPDAFPPWLYVRATFGATAEDDWVGSAWNLSGTLGPALTISPWHLWASLEPCSLWASSGPMPRVAIQSAVSGGLRVDGFRLGATWNHVSNGKSGSLGRDWFMFTAEAELK